MKRILKRVFVLVILALAMGGFIAPKSAFAADAIVVTTEDELLARFATGTGGDVKLGANITISGSYTMKAPINLDLNGKTLTIADNKCLFVYTDAVIFDSTTDKKGKITGNYNENFIVRVGRLETTDVSAIHGTLQLDSGSIVATGGNDNNAVYLVNGDITVNGGLISAPSYAIYSKHAGDKTIVNGGTVEATALYIAIFGTNGTEFTLNGGKIYAKDYAVYHAGKITINGGIIESEGLGVRSNENSTFVMNDGVIKTNSDDDVAVSFQNGSVGVFNGGTVLAENGVDDNKGSAGIIGFKNSDITINDGVVVRSWGNAIMGNGSDSGGNEGTNAKFTINAATIVATHGLGVYAPQVNGVTKLNGTTITALGGVEVRAGKLEVDDVHITVTSPYYVIGNANGSTTVGAAISVAQHTTKQPIDVVIKAGDYDAVVPFSFTNPMNHPQEIVDLVTISIEDGTFNTINDGTVSVYEIEMKYISGGYYDFPVEDFIKDGYQEVIVEHNNKQMYHVVGPRDIYIEAGSEEYITSVSKNPAVETDVIIVETGEAPEGYMIVVEAKDASGRKIKVQQNKFTMPDANVYLKAKLAPLSPDVPNTGVSGNTWIESATPAVSIGSIICSVFVALTLRKRIKTKSEE
jgi:hypothetical protein